MMLFVATSGAIGGGSDRTCCVLQGRLDMHLQTCPECGVTVVPMADGVCPSCREKVWEPREASAASRTPTWQRSQDTTPSEPASIADQQVPYAPAEEPAAKNAPTQSVGCLFPNPSPFGLLVTLQFLRRGYGTDALLNGFSHGVVQITKNGDLSLVRFTANGQKQSCGEFSRLNIDAIQCKVETKRHLFGYAFVRWMSFALGFTVVLDFVFSTALFIQLPDAPYLTEALLILPLLLFGMFSALGFVFLFLGDAIIVSLYRFYRVDVKAKTGHPGLFLIRRENKEALASVLESANICLIESDNESVVCRHSSGET